MKTRQRRKRRIIAYKLRRLRTFWTVGFHLNHGVPSYYVNGKRVNRHVYLLATGGIDPAKPIRLSDKFVTYSCGPSSGLQMERSPFWPTITLEAEQS